MKRGAATITREVKTLPFQVKDFNDEKGTVSGYLSTFNNVDEGGDRVLPGAFKRTIANKYEYKKKHEMNYLMPLLWQHDDKTPIGGYTDLKEDKIGLFVEMELDLDVQKGKEAYSALKKGYVFQQSIGYDTLQSDYIQVEGKLVRDLIEIRLWEGSIVTFPMNTEAVVTNVKSFMDSKGVCGNTSGAIGPRDEAWSGSKAEKQIWAAAEKEDGTISSSIAKKYFMNCDGDGSKKGDYGYPFWYVGDSPHICVGAVKSIAGAIQGARGASAPSGLKSKVEKLYGRINSKYPDDPELTVPWKGKSKMLKTIMEHYADEMAQDLLEDWQDVFVCALTCAVFDAFNIGDSPEQDISDALDGFKELVMEKFVPEAMECDLSGYLTDNSYSSADYTLQNGSPTSSYYGYMRTNRIASLKAGRAVSAATQQKIDAHVENVKSLLKSAKSSMKDHAGKIHDAADSIASLAGDDTSKAGRAMSAATAQSIQDKADTVHDLADKAKDIMNEHVKAVTTAADDFANTMQGAEPTYADDPGTPDPGQQEGEKRRRNPIAPPDKARNSQDRPSQDTALEEQDLAEAFKILQTVKETA